MATGEGGGSQTPGITGAVDDNWSQSTTTEAKYKTNLDKIKSAGRLGVTHIRNCV